MSRYCHSCSNEFAVYACFCKDPPILLCNNHSHGRLSTALHQQSYIYRTITPEECRKAHNACKDALIELELSEKSCINIFTELMKNIKTEFAKIEEIFRISKSKIGKILKYLNTYNYIVSLVEPNQDEKEIITLMNTGIVDIPKPVNLIPIFDSFKTIIQSNGQKDEKMILPIPSTQEVMVFDLVTFKTESFSSTCQDFSYGYGFSLLPNNDFLIYGGALGLISIRPKQFSMTGISILINPYTCTTKMLSEGNQKGDIGNGTYLNGFIYVFGGYNSACTALASCEKYQYAENKWISINDLPEPIGDSTSSAFNKIIYVCGKKNSSVYCYNPDFNTYSLSASVSGKDKVLLTTKNFILLMQGKNIFVNRGEEFEFIKYNEIEINSMLLCPFIEKDNYIYFILGKHNLLNGTISVANLYRLHTTSLINELITKLI